MNVKLLSAIAAFAMVACAIVGVAAIADESDAAGEVYYTPKSNTNYVDQGTINNPITDLTRALPSDSSASNASTVPLVTIPEIYVYVGADVRLNYVQSDQQRIFVAAMSVTSGFGVSIDSISAPDWAISADSRFSDVGSVVGTFTKAGDFSVTYLEIISGSVREASTTIHVVEAEDNIDFTSPPAVDGISGGSISYTAATNIAATFTEVGGTGASWLSVSSTGVVTGTFPTVTSMQSYTFQIKAVSKTLSTNTATQTITIDVYPVAQISATTTSITGTEGEAISSVSLSGNLDLTFSKSSGTWPSGISMTSAGVISGTPTESGNFSVVVRGTTTEGPVQNPKITIKFVLEAAEPTLTVTVGTPAASYKVGSSISLDVGSNVTGTTWKLSGTAASFLSVSGSKIVGSVPSTYTEAIDLSLTVQGTSPKGQTASKTIEFGVEPVITFTTAPTADCVITPVYSYGEDGTPTLGNRALLIPEVDAATADFSFTDTLIVCGTFTGTNAEIVTWYWGDGSSDVGNKVNHTYAEPGVYEIRLVASNEVDSDEITLQVQVGDEGHDLLYWAVIGALVILVLFFVFKTATIGNRRNGGNKGH